jgi:hypothetical protein
MAVVNVYAPYITWNNPSAHWVSGTVDFYLNKERYVKAAVHLSKFNTWDGDVAAEAFISEVAREGYVGVFELTRPPTSIGYTLANRITFGLDTYGPIEATAILLVHAFT